MSSRKLATTLRLPKETAENLDLAARRHGFATRAKFIVHSAETYTGTADDQIASEIAQLNFTLHQANRASANKLHILKPDDLRSITRRAEKALHAVIDRNVK